VWIDGPLARPLYQLVLPLTLDAHTFGVWAIPSSRSSSTQTIRIAPAGSGRPRWSASSSRARPKEWTALPADSRLDLMKVPERKTGKHRVHLHRYTPDREAEVERLIVLGASVYGTSRTKTSGGRRSTTSRPTSSAWSRPTTPDAHPTPPDLRRWGDQAAYPAPDQSTAPVGSSSGPYPSLSTERRVRRSAGRRRVPGHTLAPAPRGRTRMIVAMASFKSREGADEGELERTFERMRELVATIPGFVSYKSYVAEDGEELEVARFESEEALQAWRSFPEHFDAQRRGRDEFFDEYWVQVCVPIRQYRFTRGSGYSDELPWSRPS